MFPVRFLNNVFTRIQQNNPVFTLPSSLNFTDALINVPLAISFADRLNETAVHVDYVLPSSHFLEDWNDASPRKGIFSLVQPVINPLYNTRPFQKSLLQWSALAGQEWHDYIQNNWLQEIYPANAGGKTFKVFWDKTLQLGVLNTLGGASEIPQRTHPVRNFLATALSALSIKKNSKAPYLLALYPSVALYDGRDANNAWLQEVPDPISKVTWDNYLSIAPKVAKKMRLKEGDVVRLAGDNLENFEIPVHIQPKLNEKTLMLAVGYGQTKAGRTGNGVGVNAYPLQKTTDAFVEWTGLPLKSFAKTGVNLTLAIPQGHQTTAGRPIIKETTFKEFKKNPHAGNEAHHKFHESIWPRHKYEGYRWGMAIDMSACTGCSACSISCQSENNVLSVGKEQVILGRIMTWIRIDRYYMGGADDPEITFQPMLCQQCENAPCETVCPVLATVHNDEGLNIQIYNRCVGTRYCMNNCPYKVRRFNYFDYYKEVIAPLNLAFNPDITVRTRGIMEKCSFCIQRITEAKDRAKDDDRKLRDGDVITACQQTCPADAITFGDINNPKSRISKVKKSPRGYYVLEEVNAGPQITYLLKVRNKETS